MQKHHLTGAVDSPAGTAPEEAWTAVGGEIRRPQDLWISGHPSELLTNPGEWHAKIRDRATSEADPALGLRLRFVLGPASSLQVDLLGMVGAVLESLPDGDDQLFLHAEVMRGPEEGLYIAYDNRPPALLTQSWISHRDQAPVGQIDVVDAPFHVNVIFHDSEIGFRESWNDGTLAYALERLRPLAEQPMPTEDIHQLTLARADSHDHGISLGVESIRTENGADRNAAEPNLENRATLPLQPNEDGDSKPPTAATGHFTS